jgi:hypothetical protein
MTSPMRHTRTMKKLAAAVLAAGLVVAVPTAAHASHRHSAEGHAVLSATANDLGPCKADPDHIGGSTCEISTETLHNGTTQVGVQVQIDNFNAYPVRVRTIWQDAAGGPQTTVFTRVSAHDAKSFTVPWGSAQRIYLQYMDTYNGRQLGSSFVDKP